MHGPAIRVMAVVCLPLILALLLLPPLATPLVHAQTNDGELPDPGTLPDSPFYGLKRFFEGFATAFTFGEDARAMRALDLAELRLAEVRAVSEIGRPEFVEGLTADYEKEIENSNRAIASISDPERRKAVSERVAVSTSRHLDELDRVKERVPEQARTAIESAKERSMNGNMEALRALASEDPERAAEIAMRVAQDRAEKVREAAVRGDGSKVIEATGQYTVYMRFGEEISSIAQQVGKDPSRIRELVANATSIHTTVLEGVRERVPEDARSSIERAIEESRWERAEGALNNLERGGEVATGQEADESTTRDRLQENERIRTSEEEVSSTRSSDDDVEQERGMEREREQERERSPESSRQGDEGEDDKSEENERP